jgi:hypothetical protein
MPNCKNDNTRTYVGNEPSPKGLGYCAHAEIEGKIMKGKDGNNWIKSSGRWNKIVEYKLEKIKKVLEKKIYSWFKKISTEGVFIINKENKCKFYKGNDIKKLDIDEINMIIWTSQSLDSLTFFINYILEKIDNEMIENLIKSKNSLLYILDNQKKFLKKSKLFTDKDFTLQRQEKINDSKIIKKLQKSTKLLTLLK